MNRRTFLAVTGTAGIGTIAGCFGGDDSQNTGSQDTDSTSPLVDGEIDPGADYIVRGPEGLFSARGPLNTDLDGVAIHGYDLVAYFESETPVEGSTEHEHEYRGATFRFASEDHRAMFAEDPESYLPEYGGYCSLGVGNGYKDGMHPAAFDIFDGKLYFNLTPSIHEGWLQNYEPRIESANDNWPEIRHSTDSLHIGPGIGPV